MKQNLQTPATPLEMLSLFLPAGLLDYFGVSGFSWLVSFLLSV